MFGGDKVVSKDNDFLWVPVLYITDDGQIEKAYICQDYLERVEELSLSDFNRVPQKMIVNTSRHYGVPLNLRSDTKIDPTNVITSIPNGTIITTTGDKDKRSGFYKWTKISYTDSNGNTYEGWVASSFLDELDLVKMQVDTSKDGKINLNVRKEPSLDSEIIAGIEHGTVLEIPQEFLDNAVKEENSNRKWVQVVLNDGSNGYVSSSYLQPVKEITKDQEKKVLDQKSFDKIKSNISVRNNGNVVGIDASNITPDQLRSLLNKDDAIPDTCYRYGQKFDISDSAGKIDFVILRIGARGWGAAGNMVDNGTGYIQLANICEELGVPYGFYFYSTAITKEEADEEISYCINGVNAIGERKYNLIPFSLDLETHIQYNADGSATKSRVIGHDQTEVAAYWANEAEKKLGKIMIYTAGKNLNPSNYEYIINCERLNQSIMSGKPKIWLVGMRNPNNSYIYGQDDYNTAKEKLNVVMTQTMLDGENREEGLPNVDIDIIKAEDFIDMINDRRNEMLNKTTIRGDFDKDSTVALIDEKDDSRNI